MQLWQLHPFTFQAEGWWAKGGLLSKTASDFTGFYSAFEELGCLMWGWGVFSPHFLFIDWIAKGKQL